MYFHITLLFYLTVVHKKSLIKLALDKVILEHCRMYLHECTAALCATFDLRKIFHT